MQLILAQVYNGRAGRYGAIHPTCRPCFDSTAQRWDKDKVLRIRLDEVTDPEAKPSREYMWNECFYCGHTEGA